MKKLSPPTSHDVQFSGRRVLHFLVLLHSLSCSSSATSAAFAVVILVGAEVVLTVTPVANFAKAELMRRSLDVTLFLIWCVRVITQCSPILQSPDIGVFPDAGCLLVLRYESRPSRQWITRSLSVKE